MPTLYRVLDKGVSREKFADAAGALHLTRANVFPAAGENGYEEAWINGDGSTGINYIEDPFTGLTYLAVEGSIAGDLVAALSRKLNIYSPDQLIEEAHFPDIEHNERVANLFRLALTFPEFDSDVRDIFQNYATYAPHPKLRTAALDAIGLRAWEELRPVVAKVAEDDPDPEVRQFAGAVLERWIAARAG